MYTKLNTDQITDQLMSCQVMGSSEVAYDCCRALAEWLEAYEEGMGESIELDPISLRCTWSPYDYTEAEENWCIDTSDAENHEEWADAIEEYLRYNTDVIVVTDNLLLIAEF